jgi:hypothetical protein
MKPHRHIACASSFSKQRFFQRSFWVEDAPYRAAHYWRLESKDECMLPNHQVKHMEGCQSLLLVVAHAGQSARLSTCLPKQFGRLDFFLYIVSISVVLLFDMYYMYWASADVFMHACTETRRSGWHSSVVLLLALKSSFSCQSYQYSDSSWTKISSWSFNASLRTVAS